MAKAAILDVLESTIGRYVLNLDAESLNVAVWSGKIELNSLKLNVDAVNKELARQALEAPNLAVPVRVVDGSFDSLRVEVPWARITNRPVVFRARGLNVLVEPYDHLSEENSLEAKSTTSKASITTPKRKKGLNISLSSTDIAKKKKKDRRIQSLTYAEESRKRENAVRKLASLDDEEGSSGDNAGLGNSSGTRSGTGNSFGAKLVRRIVENLQFEIDDVHIALRGCGCAAGIVLESLSLVTTDHDGNRTFVDRVSNSKDVSKSFLFKALQIKGLGIYCDEDTSVGSRSPNLRRLAIPREDEPLGEHSYVLSPLSFEAKLRQSDLVKCIGFPKYLLCSELSSVSIVLSRTQMELVNDIALALAPKMNVARPLFPEYRPTVPISSHTAKLWWKYAVRCIGRLNRRRLWPEMMIAFRKRQIYIPLYKRAAHCSKCSWMKQLCIAEVIEMDTIEKDLSVSVKGIMIWRNMSDAQAEAETKKHDTAAAARKKLKLFTHKKPLGSSLFGNKRSNNNDVGDRSLLQDDDPPITLTVEEMKELESLGKDAAAEETISSDSMLCDVKFTLESFKVNLITFRSQPLAALYMGKVDLSFVANVDGSFCADFSMLSLKIDDRVTANSLFPSIVRSLQSATKDSSSSPFTHAFVFKMTKSQSGNQDLVLKMVAFEIVASSVLMKELKDFVTFSNGRKPLRIVPQNPVLQESVTGGADLFYDANEGLSSIIIKSDLSINTKASIATDKLSAALSEAWSSKQEKKTSWTAECEIHAPILVLPKSCIDPWAPVLVVDLGNFKFVYGKAKPSVSVAQWFESRPAPFPDRVVDHSSLEMDRMSFVVGTAGNQDWDKSESAIADARKRSSEAIIEPLTLSLQMGIENNPSNEGEARKCMFGILPAINLRISPSQLNRILSVTSTWNSFSNAMKDEMDATSQASRGIQILDEDVSLPFSAEVSSKTTLKNSPANKLPVGEDLLNKPPSKNVVEQLHVSIALRRLSVKLFTGEEDSLEAHLVSAVASSTQRTDGSSSSRICMGWFWVLDGLKSDLPRRQRMIAHSTLPKSAASYAEGGSYSIMDDLRQLGVFEDEFSGSSHLADITITKSPRWVDFAEVSPSIMSGLSSDMTAIYVDASFTSLCINWNPHAVKHLLIFKEKMISFSSSAGSTTETIPSPSRSVLPQSVNIREFSNQVFKATNNSKLVEGQDPQHTYMVVKANLKALEICMNSAKDDLPLFLMTMAETTVQIQVSHTGEEKDDENLLASVVVGDFRLETPQMGKILPEYRTILGLAPSHKTSLLSAIYGTGCNVIRSCTLPDIDKRNSHAFGDITLSPMRYVHVQAQILTLIEYVTEGVLGALTASMATSAATAAIELAQTACGEKLFQIKATGMDFVIPQASYSPLYFVLHAGDLKIRYKSLSAPGAGEATLLLNKVTMECSRNDPFIETPIRMSIDVSLAPIDAPTDDDRAMRVNISISRAAFLLSKQQYAQIMTTLDCNVSEKVSFLRDTVVIRRDAVSESQGLFSEHLESDPNLIRSLTHGGAQLIEVQKRMYIDLEIQSLSLELCGEDIVDPIISLAAVETHISVKLLSDERKMRANITMLNLVCDDKRMIATNRSFRSLIRQVHDTSGRDVFRLAYEKSEIDNSTMVDITVGSPQIVLIPDALADLMSFFKTSHKPKAKIATQRDDGEGSDMMVETVAILVSESEEGVEAMVGCLDCQKTIQKSLTLKTSDCRLVIIDMGNLTELGVSGSMESSMQVTETIVLQGKTDASLRLVFDGTNGSLVESDIQLHGEKIEAYTAQGENLRSPVQILEPTQLSVFFTSVVKNNVQDADLRIVALSSVDVILSMQNAALMRAILASLSDSFAPHTKNNELSSDLRKLSEAETKRIEELSSALELLDRSESDSTLVMDESTKNDISASCSSLGRDEARSFHRKLCMKATLPETSLTVINDLQGFDEALFKIIVRSFVSGAEVSIAGDVLDISRPKMKQKPLFSIHINTSILSDYFDSHTSLWEPLLVKPWELTFSGSRSENQRIKSARMSSTFDIESHPCNVSFSEQFLISLGAASKMWSVYTGATKKAIAIGISAVQSDLQNRNESYEKKLKKISVVKSMAANAARSLITTMPYAVENHSGLMVYFEVIGLTSASDVEKMPCPSGSTQYFKFDPKKGAGVGGKRAYGQDVTQFKTLHLYVGESTIEIPHLDADVGQSKRAHRLDFGRYIFTDVVKTGKATILHLSSYMNVHNNTRLPLKVFVNSTGDAHYVGICPGKTDKKKAKTRGTTSTSIKSPGEFLSSRASVGSFSRTAATIGIPIDLLPRANEKQNQDGFSLVISPLLEGIETSGTISLPPLEVLTIEAKRRPSLKTFEVACTSAFFDSTTHRVNSTKTPCRLIVQVCFRVSLIADVHPCVELFIQPRALLQNNMHVNILVCTPMPNTLSASMEQRFQESGVLSEEVVHKLSPFDTIEIFTPGPSIAVSVKCADLPTGGALMGWNDLGWIDLPLESVHRLLQPIKCKFPFLHKNGMRLATGSGSDFSIVEAADIWNNKKIVNVEDGEGQKGSEPENSSISQPHEKLRTLFLTVQNIAVDHTGEILFEEAESNVFASNRVVSDVRGRGSMIERTTVPFGAFSSEFHRRRITLLPDSGIPIRLMKMTIDSAEGFRRSLPFLVDDIALCEGGIESSAILWEDGTQSGYFSYQKLGSYNQSEIHVIPEFVVFNGGTDVVCIKQAKDISLFLDPGKMAPVQGGVSKSGLILMFNFNDLGAATSPLRVDALGLKVSIVRSSKTGSPLGSLAVQTVIGSRDSRFVIKIGPIKYGGVSGMQAREVTKETIFSDDFFRFRVRWSQFEISLGDTGILLGNETLASQGRLKSQASSVEFSNDAANSNEQSYLSWHQARLDHDARHQGKSFSYFKVARIVFECFTVDFQRIFKDNEGMPGREKNVTIVSPERSQLAIIIHNVQIINCAPRSTSVVLNSSSPNTNFFDLCVRTRGSHKADLVKVDLIDLNLAYSKGRTDSIVLNTTEEFLWSLLDIANRTKIATSELAGVDLELDWDEERGEYTVTILDDPSEERDNFDDDDTYKAPRSDKLFDIRTARVSPVTFLVSFKRQPQMSRYKLVKDVRGAKLMNYFSTRLKFTVDKAELKFNGFLVKNVKGPPDRLIEMIKAFYTSRMKLKLFNLLSAASLNDWKYLSGRGDGNEEYVEGDILRLTGNLAGRSAGFILKRVGEGLGDGITNVTAGLGNELQRSTESWGVGAVGAGANSLLSGVGEGVGSTVKGVGAGTGKVLRGAGQGVGQFVGGVGGGVQLAAKGIGKGVMTGDGRAVLLGLGEGAESIGSGVGRGVESVVTGAAEGIFSVGKGLFSGVQSVGMGVGGAFTGGKKQRKAPGRQK